MALAFCRKAGYRPELAWSCCDYADLLLERNGDGDLARGDHVYADLVFAEYVENPREEAVALEPGLRKEAARDDNLGWVWKLRKLKDSQQR